MRTEPSVRRLSFPVDHTRVVLNDRDPNEPGSDYINANIIMVNSAATVRGKTYPTRTFSTYSLHDNAQCVLVSSCFV